MAGPDLRIVLGCQLPMWFRSFSMTFNTSRGDGTMEGFGAKPATSLTKCDSAQHAYPPQARSLASVDDVCVIVLPARAGSARDGDARRRFGIEGVKGKVLQRGGASRDSVSGCACW